MALSTYRLLKPIACTRLYSFSENYIVGGYLYSGYLKGENYILIMDIRNSLKRGIPFLLIALVLSNAVSAADLNFTKYRNWTVETILIGVAVLDEIPNMAESLFSVGFTFMIFIGIVLLVTAIFGLPGMAIAVGLNWIKSIKIGKLR